MSEENLNELMLSRRRKLEQLIESGEDPYKSQFRRTYQISQIVESYGDIEPGAGTNVQVKIAGRIILMRKHGKASFAVLKDGSGQLQLYLTSDELGEDDYRKFLEFDIGDIVGVEGEVFKTNRGELSVKVKDYVLLTKSLRPLPEKWHGLKDKETRYRQRYVDLIMNPDVSKIFLTRNRIIQSIRAFLDQRGFIEVETPMLQSIPGGATAKPFITHHQALDIDLYLRIAPELYLKRLVVGGMEKVYELSRNFRNEGMSIKHNPEFTMLEVYAAYQDYSDMMELTEEMIKKIAKDVLGTLEINYQDQELDLSKPWKKLSVIESLKAVAGIEASFDQSVDELRLTAKKNDVEIEDMFGKGKIITELFEKLVEPKLVEPTFIRDYPKEVTPLARSHPENPNLTERFELIVTGREIANAFSELTNPQEQRKRFEEQVTLREKGDEEAQLLDEDFVRALEYGMPPAGGLGIGIDRLVMLFSDAPSIRDVLLFPQLRPEK